MIHARNDYNRIQDPENKIGEDEPVFLLRAKDKTAPRIVREWANEQIKEANPDKKVAELAFAHADRMEKWQEENGCKLADV